MIEPSEPTRLYLDSNIFIYAIEGDVTLANRLHELFGVLQAKRGTAVTSELTLAEVLPKATDVQRRSYLSLIVWNRIFDLRPVSRDILIETSDYRKLNGMPKLPDAIHVVTAIRAGCRMILSADRGLRLPAGHSVILPDHQSLSRLIRELS
jgi:predicted nucleic acid-binding protein